MPSGIEIAEIVLRNFTDFMVNDIPKVVKTVDNVEALIDKYESINKKYPNEDKSKNKNGVRLEDLKVGNFISINGKKMEIIFHDYNEKVEYIRNYLGDTILNNVITISFPKSEDKKIAIIKVKRNIILGLDLDTFDIGFSLLLGKYNYEDYIFSNQLQKEYFEIIKKYLSNDICNNLRVDNNYIGATLNLENILNVGNVQIFFERIKLIYNESVNVVDDIALQIFEKLIKEYNFELSDEKSIYKIIDKKKKYVIYFSLNNTFCIRSAPNNEIYEKDKEKYICLLKQYILKYYNEDIKITNEYIGNFLDPFIIKNNKDVSNFMRNYKKLEDALRL